MPTYDYECKECAHTFEVFQSMSDEPLKVCPECNGELRRLIGGGMGVIFKGSGFYVNDSKGKNSTVSSTATDNSSSSKNQANKVQEKKKEPAAAPKTETKTG